MLGSFLDYEGNSIRMPITDFKVRGITINIHAMPCTNFCKHCWAQGSPKKRRMPLEQILFVLEKVAELKDCFPTVGFFFLDEPTNHPHFVEIIERASELGLLGGECFISTNGSILSRAPDEVWVRLKKAGVQWLQLTLYGLERTHDEFARRQGAFRDVIITAKRATEYGIRWWLGVIFHRDNAHELAETTEYAKSLDPSGEADIGWYTFLWQGRGRSARRPRAKDYALLPDSLKGECWVEEREAVRKILASPDLSARRADESFCPYLGLEVDQDLWVFCGGACDSGGIARAVPELREEFALGHLGEEGFLPLLESYQHEPPRVIQLLSEVTWGELAERYGDETNDEIYHLTDLPLHKWAAQFLLEESGR